MVAMFGFGKKENRISVVGPKKNPVFRAPDPTYRNQPTLDFFLTKIPFFRWGLYN